MIPEEIQALREKHHPWTDVDTGITYCDNYCDQWEFPYPCDVIKVLDALEAERKIQACDHRIPMPITDRPVLASALGHERCPKCQEKL